MTAPSTIPREEWQLPMRRLGRRVLVFDMVDSTNSRAAALADDPGHDGVVILAGSQTAGRGQYGRSWLSSPGAGVLLSVLLFPPMPLRRPALLTAWAAVAVCATIRDLTGLEATIKWPNDVLLNCKKVCGILIEQGRGTVVGIGLNVRQTSQEFLAAGLPEAVSLQASHGSSLDTNDVARRLIARLDSDYDRLERGDLTTLESAWRSHLGLLGKQVTAECHDGRHQGRLVELGWDGVVMELDGAELIRLSPESVRQLSAQVD
jgi:BirA family biotin operon repressor/biotin-[acetyl-CoA-carboxylase] ligase